jgi:6-phosphogluconate dehydrogenase
MIGGDKAAFERLEPICATLAPGKGEIEPTKHREARNPTTEEGYLHCGPVGAGHFVKMVHNGIEYSDMQLIGEAYQLLRDGLGLSAIQIADVFTEWNSGDLDSFLVEITAEVLRQVDAKTGKPLVDVIVDEAEQKGTGRWTVKSALDLGVPVTGIAEAVFARALSGSVPQRRAAAGLASGHLGERPTEAKQFITDVRQALYASKIIAYAQGFNQIQAGSDEYDWGITPGVLATIWRGGCIIRAKFLNRIKEAFDADPALPTLLADPYFRSAVESAVDGWRRVVVTATELGIPIPGFSSALSYYDGLRTERLPAALIQGQRDFFGAHTYGRTDADPAARFHTLWSAARSEVQM